MKALLAPIASAMVCMPSFPRDPEPDARFDTVIVTGSKTDDFFIRSGVPLAQMPQSVQVIDTEALFGRGARSVEDLLRTVPSATVGGSRESRYQSFSLKIRGFSADEMRNGMRQRYYEDVDPSALSDIGRIEVLKGPSAVLFGQMGMGGIISITTKPPTEDFAGWAALTGGSFDRKMATVDVGGPINDTLGIRVTGEVERSGTFVDYQDMDRDNAGLALAWRPNSSVSAHFVAETIRRSTQNNPGQPVVGTVQSNGIAPVDRSTFLGEPGFTLLEADAPLVQAWVDFKLGDAWTTLTPRFQYSEFNNVGKQAVLGAPVPGQTTLIQRTGRYTEENDRFYTGQIDLSGRATGFGVRHQLLFGVEYNNEEVAFRQFGVVPCGIGPIDSLHPVYGCGAPTDAFGFLSVNKIDGVALYAQDQIALTQAWNLIAGMRYSKFDNDNTFSTDFFSAPSSADLSSTTWQLGTTYALGQGVSLFGGYNTGFDLEYVIGARRRDGTPFQPETGDQAEVGVRLIRDTVRTSLSAFSIRRNNVAAPDPADPGFQVQEGQYRVRGVEVEGEWSPLPGWWLQGGYAYLDGQVTRTTTAGLVGAQLAETPRNSATASTRVMLGPVELRAGANYVGSRKMINGGSVTLPDYLVFDLGLGAAYGPLRLEAALTNVGNTTYYYTDNASVYSAGGENAVYPGSPRTFSLRVSYAFGGATR